MAGRPNSNRRVALILFAVVPVMVAASFAAVPFYSWFCRVTGFAGTTGIAGAPAAEEVDRLVTVNFDANIAPGMPWEFRPQQQSMTLRLGETGLAFFEAYNPTDKPTAGQAGFNVVPFSVGGYFDKIACFCFDLQVLGPGERVEMPVSFYVDPAMLDDREAKGVTNITLSYTMYPADLPEAAAGNADNARFAAAPAGRQTIEQ
ncbi:MAG TPA: cytochrome c oxidase assembly protein [Amaricoccus sp.]|nr:cytochrome c oxidase assembly protein [Amaricoccus sp.]